MCMIFMKASILKITDRLKGSLKQSNTLFINSESGIVQIVNLLKLFTDLSYLTGLASGQQRQCRTCIQVIEVRHRERTEGRTDPKRRVHKDTPPCCPPSLVGPKHVYGFRSPLTSYWGFQGNENLGLRSTDSTFQREEWPYQESEKSHVRILR